jgi:hypothetical protein
VNRVEAHLKYVGVLRKIMSVDFSSLKVNILKCQWYQPDLMGRPTMRVDEYGFWKLKENTFQEVKNEPYLLPAHASQVPNNPEPSPVCFRIVDVALRRTLSRG